MLSVVGPQYLVEALFYRTARSQESTTVVAGGFGEAYTPFSGTCEVLFNLDLDGLRVEFAYRAGDNGKGVLFRGACSHKLRRREQEGAQVERCVFTAGNPFCIQANELA